MEGDAVDKMLKDNVSKAITTEQASPFVFTLINESGLWFCVYYRKSNAVAVRDSYSIARMDKCIDSLGTANVLSTLVANSGY